MSVPVAAEEGEDQPVVEDAKVAYGMAADAASVKRPASSVQTTEPAAEAAGSAEKGSKDPKIQETKVGGRTEKVAEVAGSTGSEAGSTGQGSQTDQQAQAAEPTGDSRSVTSAPPVGDAGSTGIEVRSAEEVSKPAEAGSDSQSVTSAPLPATSDPPAKVDDLPAPTVDLLAPTITATEAKKE
jgi:hypothetical protein